MIYRFTNGDEVHVNQERYDVKSLNRPDTSWVVTDAAGHEHRWYLSTGDVAARYDPELTYDLPTLERVTKDVVAYVTDEDEEVHVWHWECRRCSERIEPGAKADDTPQYIRGRKSADFVVSIPVAAAEALGLVDADDVRSVLLEGSSARVSLPMSTAARVVSSAGPVMNAAGDEIEAVAEGVARLLMCLKLVDPNWTPATA